MRRKIDWLILALVVAILLTYFIYFKPMNDERNNQCQERELSVCTYGTIQCYDDCQELNLEYFRYNDGGFGLVECWCKFSDTTTQIY